MLKKIAIAATVFFAACVDDGVEGQAGSLPTEETPTEEPVVSQLARVGNTEDAPNLCELLPPGDGACAHACDPDALLAFIPEGTCATFVCELVDGTQHVTGGCNW